MIKKNKLTGKRMKGKLIINRHGAVRTVSTEAKAEAQFPEADSIPAGSTEYSNHKNNIITGD